ncbi:unnamed protein product [Brassica napus]|uniref:(rape) hypothetical protein n=1 Tax=Brassica napus TaxID=3708 RepID=A0A816IWH1_BRANA|nr:unnamed protein product [Brassica napus]
MFFNTLLRNSFHLFSKKRKRKSLSSTLWPDGESKVLIAERDGLVGELMKSIRRDSDSSLIKATLFCLIAISSPRRVKLNLIREKLIKGLTAVNGSNDGERFDDGEIFEASRGFSIHKGRQIGNLRRRRRVFEDGG